MKYTHKLFSVFISCFQIELCIYTYTLYIYIYACIYIYYAPKESRGNIPFAHMMRFVAIVFARMGLLSSEDCRLTSCLLRLVVPHDLGSFSSCLVFY